MRSEGVEVVEVVEVGPVGYREVMPVNFNKCKQNGISRPKLRSNIEHINNKNGVKKRFHGASQEVVSIINSLLLASSAVKPELVAEKTHIRGVDCEIAGSRTS